MRGAANVSERRERIMGPSQLSIINSGAVATVRAVLCVLSALENRVVWLGALRGSAGMIVR